MKKALFLLSLMIGSIHSNAGPATSPAGISGPVKLAGACTVLGFHHKFIDFVLVQDPLGGVESKYGFVPDANARLTVEIENLGFQQNGSARFYTVKFTLHSFRGDEPVFEDEERFEFLGDEQKLSAIVVGKDGVKVECLAEFRSNDGSEPFQ